ncbi:MAG: orotate phosphoribosyltransferase [Spirochaetes bacterium]|nr:orotate phosphoribosyltransferase [Spirochaetota bacterium]
MRTDEHLLGLLKKSEALLEGHFLLSSGLHSNQYVQCAKLTMYPEHAAYVAEKLAALYKNENVDVVIGGAFGGILIAYEIARVLGVRNIFAERVDNVFALRRGFFIAKGERVLIAEDVCTTGKSILEVKTLVDSYGGIVAGAASIIDRSQPEGAALGMRKEWLHSVAATSWKADECPLCKAGGKPVKPGSRK